MPEISNLLEDVEQAPTPASRTAEGGCSTFITVIKWLCSWGVIGPFNMKNDYGFTTVEFIDFCKRLICYFSLAGEANGSTT